MFAPNNLIIVIGNAKQHEAQNLKKIVVRYVDYLYPTSTTNKPPFEMNMTCNVHVKVPILIDVNINLLSSSPRKEFISIQCPINR
jgi:hypothetical protein